jgi:hypothetical protein
VYTTYSAQATTMNKIIGNAKVRIDPPKLHAPPAESAIIPCTPDPFFLFGSLVGLQRPNLYYKA